MRPKKQRGWPIDLSVSLNEPQEELLQVARDPALRSRGPRIVERKEPAYFATFFGWRSGSGLRICGFTAVSSTGVVPVTSELKFAPAGTR